MITDKTNKDVLSKFDSIIGPYIDCLLSSKKDNLKLISDPIRITDYCSGYLNPKTQECHKCDRFTLKIPYAQQVLTWQVIFDNSNLKDPPDFIFDADDYDFQPPLAEIKSLICWDWQNQECLVAAVTELLDHYATYMQERACTNSTLQKHVQSLLSQDVKITQLIVNRATKSLGTLNCLVTMDSDFSRMSTILSQGDPGEACAILHICIPYPESTSIEAQLYLSPVLECAFGSSSSLRIPAYPSGLLVGDYVAKVKSLLDNQVKLIADGFEKRKEYLAAFIVEFGGSVVEYDAQSYKRITLLWEWNDFFFTFTVELPLYFPMEHPTFTLKSVYHNQNKRPYTEKYTDFPYSPRWSGVEMVKRACAFVLDVIRDFQKVSVNQSDK